MSLKQEGEAVAAIEPLIRNFSRDTRRGHPAPSPPAAQLFGAQEEHQPAALTCLPAKTVQGPWDELAAP